MSKATRRAIQAFLARHKGGGVTVTVLRSAGKLFAGIYVNGKVPDTCDSYELTMQLAEATGGKAWPDNIVELT